MFIIYLHFTAKLNPSNPFFVLYFVGEPEEIWVDWVHDTQEADYYCLDPENSDDEIYDTVVTVHIGF